VLDQRTWLGPQVSGPLYKRAAMAASAPRAAVAAVRTDGASLCCALDLARAPNKTAGGVTVANKGGDNTAARRVGVVAGDDARPHGECCVTPTISLASALPSWSSSVTASIEYWQKLEVSRRSTLAVEFSVVWAVFFTSLCAGFTVMSTTHRICCDASCVVG
jgi:hypothetical protein